MPTYTTTYSLGKPVVGADEDAWGDTLNASLDSIDDILDGTTPVTGIDINSGTLDGVTIGGTTAGAGTFTTLTANTSITGTLATAAQPNITSVGTLTGLTVSASASLAGASTSADITFGDNDKAIFGAGNDLQIYHDGTTNYVYALADININANTGVNIQAKNGEESIVAEADGAVTLYYDNASKLATTSTGVDITGTLTSDGLTVDGDTFVQSSSGATLTLKNTNTTVTSGDLLGQLDFYNSDPSGDGPSVQARIKATSAFSTGNGASLGFFTTIGGSGVEGAAPIERMKINQSGDISFYEDTGTTAKFFWDASAESLGIGTISPSYPLHVQGTTSAGDVAALVTNHSNDGSATLRLSPSTVATRGAFIRGLATSASGQPTDLLFATGAAYSDAAERMRITSSGSVGIGTSSPAYTLDFGTAASGHVIRVGDENQDAYMSFSNPRGFSGYSAGQNSMAIQGGFNKGIVFNVNNGTFGSGEAMRIDSSGDLLLGKTTAASTTAGMHLDANGKITTTRSSGPAAAFVRLTSDGDIVSFQKDGTTVGSIGTLNSRLVIGSGDTAVTFANNLSPKSFYPSNTSGTGQDASINLGTTTSRFKDLYLSGGVYLGGTGSANKLDDYEEGTWTPSLGGTATYNFQSGFYTKVGRQVTLVFYMDVASIGTGSTSTITGVPFSSTTFAPASGAISRFTNTAASYVSAFGQIDGSSIAIVGKTSASSSTATLSPFQNATSIYMTITYFTS